MLVTVLIHGSLASLSVCEPSLRCQRSESVKKKTNKTITYFTKKFPTMIESYEKRNTAVKLIKKKDFSFENKKFSIKKFISVS